MTSQVRRLCPVVLVVALVLYAAVAGAARADGSTSALATGSPPQCSGPPVTVAPTCPGPVVNGFAPAIGPSAGGTLVTLFGSHFSRCGGVQPVLFDSGRAPAFTTQSDTELTVITPPHAAGLAPFTVETHCGTSFPVVFTYT
jgi:hypothetical protein